MRPVVTAPRQSLNRAWQPGDRPDCWGPGWRTAVTSGSVAARLPPGRLPPGGQMACLPRARRLAGWPPARGTARYAGTVPARVPGRCLCCSCGAARGRGSWPGWCDSPDHPTGVGRGPRWAGSRRRNDRAPAGSQPAAAALTPAGSGLAGGSVRFLAESGSWWPCCSGFGVAARLRSARRLALGLVGQLPDP